MRLTSALRLSFRPALIAGACLAVVSFAVEAQESDGSYWVRERARQVRPRAESPVLMRRTQPPRRLAPRPQTPPPVVDPTTQPTTPADPLAAPQTPAPVDQTVAPATPAAAPPAPAPETLAPKAAAPASEKFVVAVIGDSLGQLLGQGLQEAFAERADIALLRKARENSGLVRDDYFDWPKAARDLLASDEKINLAIIIVGSNDRQPIREGQTTHEIYSPRWRELYAARVAAIAEAFRAKDVRLVWVGLPIMKSASMSNGASSLNDIYRQQAAKGGAAFVDIWEAFADERGQYSDYGPDVNGQSVKLRSGDGVHFTKAGARKLAHFVEGGVRNLILETRPAAPQPSQPIAHVDPGATTPVAPQAPAPTPEIAAPAAPPPRPAMGPVLSLTAQSASPGAELAQPSKGAPGAAPSVPSRSGRADDFSWSRN